MVVIPSPPMLQGDKAQQLQDVRRYLYRLVDTLNSSLNNLTAENFSQETAAALGGATREEMQQTQADLKSLIIKNANEVRQTIEKVEQTLRSEYVAISDFGTFQENMENNFIAATNGYIRQGVVGYEGLTPIIGIAIGQDIQVTGVKETVGGKEYEEIDRSQNMSIWTTKKLSFYVNGGEVAYFANDALYVTGIHTGTVTFPNWVIDDGNGLSFRWAGGNS